MVGWVWVNPSKTLFLHLTYLVINREDFVYFEKKIILKMIPVASISFLQVCEKCGLLASHNWCQYCRSSTSVNSVKMPYACKLLFQELQGMNIVPRLTLKSYNQV